MILRMLCEAADRLSTAVGVIAGWLIVPMTIAMCWEVVARYVFDTPTIWAYELAYLLTGSAWLLGMAYALSKGAHIRVDVFYRQMPPRLAAVVDASGYLLLLLPFLLWTTGTLYDRAIAAFVSGDRTGQSAWNPPIWPFYVVFLISFCLLAIQVAADLVRRLAVIAGHPLERDAG